MPPQKVPLTEFWPAGGAHWDGLAVTDSKKFVLVEAKAYIGELLSGSSKAGVRSLDRIRTSLLQTRLALGVGNANDWSHEFYQSANRLAHLYYLRELNGIDAYLVYVCVVGAPDVPVPATAEEWRGALTLVDGYLGAGTHRLKNFKAAVFMDIRALGLAV